MFVLQTTIKLTTDYLTLTNIFPFGVKLLEIHIFKILNKIVYLTWGSCWSCSSSKAQKMNWKMSAGWRFRWLVARYIPCDSALYLISVFNRKQNNNNKKIPWELILSIYLAYIIDIYISTTTSHPQNCWL